MRQQAPSVRRLNTAPAVALGRGDRPCMLADALGLSALDRMLRMLRERGVMAFRAGRVRIHYLAVGNRAEADRD